MNTEEIKLTRFFINNYCDRKYNKHGAFSKATIDILLSTYVSEPAFNLAMCEEAIGLKTVKGELEFKISLKKEYRNIEPLFKNWTPAGVRLEQLVNPNYSEVFVNQINLCLKWINEATVIRKTINRKFSSYFYKHEVERWTDTYISNDAFKIAAKQAGLKWRIAYGENEYYNLKLIKTKLNTPYAREGKNQ